MIKNKIIGVYSIHNDVTDEEYIGSSDNVYRRFASHICCLNMIKHANIILQADWIKYGSYSFTFKIIEILEDKSELAEKEQFYMNERKPKYNICQVAKKGRTINKYKAKKYNESNYY